jgi:3-oxoacyl-[acyl-carrier-protein] synthase III
MKTIYNIEAQIEAKKILLKNNHSRLKELVKQNELLADVLEDYNKYNEILMKEEDLHKNAFESLSRYITSLLEDNTLSKNDIQNLKREKREIEKMLTINRKQ